MAQQKPEILQMNYKDTAFVSAALPRSSEATETTGTAFPARVAVKQHTQEHSGSPCLLSAVSAGPSFNRRVSKY